jgi:large subunit ribosomal protein L33
MAKKSARILVGMVCEDCKKQNYVTQKNKINTPALDAQNKFCNQCRKHTSHKERKKLD